MNENKNTLEKIIANIQIAANCAVCIITDASSKIANPREQEELKRGGKISKIINDDTLLMLLHSISDEQENLTFEILKSFGLSTGLCVSIAVQIDETFYLIEIIKSRRPDDDKEIKPPKNGPIISGGEPGAAFEKEPKPKFKTMTAGAGSRR